MDFTYEIEKREAPLETYEWDNVWWEKADDNSCPRLLYIGDSISCGIRAPLNKLFGDSLHIDGFGTSKAVDNPALKASISIFGGQSQNKCAIMFNSGLHGWHLTTDEYASEYESMIKFFLAEFEKKKLILLTTTPISDPERLALVRERNTAVKMLAEKYSLALIDLYDMADGLEQKADGVHFTEESYRIIAEKMADVLKKY